MTMKLPDVQSRVPDTSYPLTRVGVRGVKKLVSVMRNNSIVTLMPTMDIFVDLPATQKGSHLSRNIEVVNEIVDESVRRPVESLEALCAKIARELLTRHGYATTSQVNMRTDYFLERQVSEGKTSVEHYQMIARASAKKDGAIKKLIGIEAVGMTACPSAMETVRCLMKPEKCAEGGPDVPHPTHNQRNVSTLIVEVPENYEIEANDLVDIVEDSFSSPTFEILKRKDEGDVVMRAHKNPKFVEDVVRDLLKSVVLRYKKLPDDAIVIARSESEESIHKHNAFAEKVTTLGELRGKKSAKKCAGEQLGGGFI